MAFVERHWWWASQYFLNFITEILTWYNGVRRAPFFWHPISFLDHTKTYIYCVNVGVLLLLWHGVRRTPFKVVSFTIFLEFRYWNIDLIVVYLLRLCRSLTPALTWRSTNAVLGASNFISSRSHKALLYIYCVYVQVLPLLWLYSIAI